MKKSIIKVMSMFLFASTILTLGGCKKDQTSNSTSTGGTNTTHVHTFAKDWSKNETEHWHAATCEHTNLKDAVAAHTYDNDSDTTCNICGYVRAIQTHTHTFATEWSKNETEHWHAATCEHKDQKDALGTHVYDNDEDTTCNTCGYVRTVHTHTFATEWSSNETEHWHAATCEHKNQKDGLAAHTFDEGVITKNPDYGVDGEKTFTCSVCGKTKIESVPALVAFFMPIEDRYSVAGGKVVVTGTIYSGTVRTGDTLTLSNVNINVTITSIEKFKKTYDSASAGEAVGLLIEGATKDQIKSGYSLFTPSTKQYYNQIKVNLTSLTKEEGGRNTPFFTKYKPVIKLYPSESNGTTSYAGEVAGCVILPSDLEMFMPGETHIVTIILKTEFILDQGMELIAVEGGKKVAYGTITALERHEHDNNYDEKGICNICGFDQYLSFNFDSESEEYIYETNLEVNEKLFFKITPKSDNTETEWQVEIDGATEDNYEVIIYESNFNIKDEDSFMLTNSTYYIVVIGKDNVNNITVKVIDTYL